MAKPTKRKVAGTPGASTGRVTPRGGPLPRASVPTRDAGRGAAPSSSRYTPPADRSKLEPSGRLVPIAMFSLLGLGLTTIVVNYMRGDAASNWFILVGLGFILSGIIVATQWR
jgi:hypothetical protein